MSHNCRDEHDASEQPGHNHPHTHQHSAPPIPTSVSQSINNRIQTTALDALCLDNPLSELPQLFKSQSTKYSLKPVFRCDEDEDEMILKIPFTGSVKLYSIILRTSRLTNKCPKFIKLFKNGESIDFSTVADIQPTFKLEHPLIGVDDADDNNEELTELVDDDTFVEHFLPRSKFTSLSSLTIHFDKTWTGSSIPSDSPSYAPGVLTLYSIELRGEFTELNRNPVVTLYEAAANPSDHKNVLAEENKNYQSL